MSSGFLAQGCNTFIDAADHVRHLPYGRNSGRPAPLFVLGDGHGTCSSKHALIAALASEAGLDIRLMLGIYEMDASNTPGIGPVSATVNLPSIPEAHCWIEYDATPFDLTSPDAQDQFRKRTFLHTEVIDPSQTAAYKTEVHRDFITAWLGRRPGVGQDAERIWAIRKQCIAALSQRARARPG